MSPSVPPVSTPADPRLAAAAEDQLRRDLLDAAVAQAPALGAAEVPGLPQLVAQYYANVSVDDLVDADPLDVLGVALSHRQLAARRTAGETLVRVFTPTVEENGWSQGHTCVEIVTDDMPFLVDSVSAALSKHGRAIHLVIHPQFDVLRDPDGTLAAVAPPVHGTDDGASLDAITESWIHFDIDRESDPETLEQLAQALTDVLADVRSAVADWPSMLTTAEGLAEGLGAQPVPGLDPRRQREAAEFVHWLVAGNFTFLGYRQYSLQTDDAGHEALAVVAGSGRGILRGGDGHVRPLRDLPQAVQARALDPDPLVLTKANSRSTVHRNAYLDYIGVKRFDDTGTVVGEDRFLGLYTAAAYNQSVTDIPVLRAKVDEVLSRSGFPADSHSGKDLQQFLETYPRDELFQATPVELLDTGLGVMRLQERRRTRLFWRRDPYERFVSCLVYLPRDRYTTTVRLRMEQILRDAFDADSIEFRTRVTESVLARLHFVVRVAPDRDLPAPDHAAVEADLAAAARSWEDVFAAELVEAAGEEDAARLMGRFAASVPEAYKEAFPARVGVADVRHLDRLPSGATELNLYRPYDAGERTRRLKIYRSGDAVSLSRILPVLQHLGVDVTDERPFTVSDAAGAPYRIYDLGLVFPDGEMPYEESLKARFEDAFLATWGGQAEVDDLNALVIHAGLNWREAALLRALVKYMRQAQLPFSRDYVQSVLLSHPQLVRDLVDLFHARFEPGRVDRADAQRVLTDRITAGIDAVTSLDVDRILRFLLTLITTCVRTSYYRPESDPFQISFKLQPRLVPGLPDPKPLYEIWVYSPQVEGVHLRFAAVARGGLRWSDRPEDFRTEILGLVKAQAVKNTVIVPAGAKGGFFAKQLPDPADREAFVTAGRAAYTRFISGLLDLTDNRQGAEVVGPEHVVRHDGDDPYLVVAADKGTATFSDLANSISADYGFWLGDAFASGGSDGYDHKAMGITAKGAWESVKRHFRDLGVDTQTQDFTVAGIGDMSGDVFGNGMLLSEHIALVAAFDHRHVFLDPHPDPAVSFAERRRLFDLPRSSWDDYDRSLLSAGGGIYPRSAKAIDITPEVRAALGLTTTAGSLTPNEMIREILRADVDLLFNGGIGTYVKATDESDAEVGDKTNDAVRVDGAQLRCRVVGEGGNLGLTQRGRIEAALHGVQLNNDAVDNSAGVDTSDHEVNIKILLDEVVRSGDLTVKQRSALLHSMTDEVAALVLRHNYDQNMVLGNGRAQARDLLPVHERMMRQLVAAGELDRELEFLPSDEEIRERAAAGRGLTSPELSVLLAYSKMTLAASLDSAAIAADPYFAPVLQQYFPTQLRERYADRMAEHPLAADIIKTVVVNDLVNHGGITFTFRAGEETAATPVDVLRGYTFARDVFDLPALWARVRDLDNQVPTSAQSTVYLEARRLLDRTTRWMVQTHSATFDLTTEVARYGPVVAELSPRLPELLRGAEYERWQEIIAELTAVEVPQDIAADTALLLYQFQLLDIVRVAERTQSAPADVAAVYFVVSERSGVDDFLTRISTLPRAGRWEALARQALRSDLYSALASLTAQVVRSTEADVDPAARVDAWEEANRNEVDRVRRTMQDIAAVDGANDLASLSVALRAMRTLVAQSRG